MRCQVTREYLLSPSVFSFSGDLLACLEGGNTILPLLRTSDMLFHAHQTERPDLIFYLILAYVVNLTGCVSWFWEWHA